MGMARCYGEEYKNWENELNRRYNELKENYPSKKFHVIEILHKNWIKFSKSVRNVNRIAHEHDSGTITIIESAARGIYPIRDYVLYLLRLPNKH